MDPFAALSSAIADRVAAVAPHLLSVRALRRRATAVAWSDTLAVTVAHPLHGLESVRVFTADGAERQAEIVSRDPAADLALLRVEGGELSPAPWADSSSARVGELVLAIGRPGRAARASLGMLSAVGPAWRTRRGVELDRSLEVDGSLPRGFSGGPLVGATGLIGLNTHDLVPGGTTLPGETVARVVEQLERGGPPQRGYLGVSTVPVEVPAALRDTVGQDAGLLVVGLDPDGPGAAAGLLQGDLIARVGERQVRSVRELVGALRGLAGQTVSVRLIRAGAVADREVAVGVRTRC